MYISLEVTMIIYDFSEFMKSLSELLTRIPKSFRFLKIPGLTVLLYPRFFFKF